MATVLLSTVGAGIGSAIGGQVFGLSMAAVGRFAGAAIGQTLDQRSASVGGAPMHAKETSPSAVSMVLASIYRAAATVFYRGN